MDHLERDPAHRARDHRAPLPQRLGDGEREALAQRLLKHYGRAPLQRVDDEVGVGREQQHRDIAAARGAPSRC